MALPRESPVPNLIRGIEVASPLAQPGTTAFRSAINFNNIVDGIKSLAIAHAGDLGGIKYIKEWWEDPAIVGEYEEFPCFYILPLYFIDREYDKTDKHHEYNSKQFVGDPLAKTVFPVTCMAYYKYLDIRQPQRDVRNYGWNFQDIILNEMKTLPKLAGLRTSTHHIGWHMSGTNYIIQWWSLQLELTSIL